MQIQGPAQRNLEIYSRRQDALNAMSFYVGEAQEIDSFAQIANHYNGAKPGSGTPGQKCGIRASQHCELTLALYFVNEWRKAQRRGRIAIGCSKASCYWCHRYVNTLNESLKDSKNDITLVSYATHGKRISGWVMPEGHDEVQDVIYDEVGSSVGEIIKAAWTIPRKKSDSRSLSPSFFVDQAEIDEPNPYEPMV